MKLLIVIVNFRTPQLVIDCLESLAPEVGTIESCRVAVVENGSGDDSAEQIRSAIDRHGWGDWATLIESSTNGGFARGNNVGIRAFPEAEYVLLLNSDTLAHSGCLDHCVQALEQDESIGAISCRLLEADETPQIVARKFPTPLRQVVCATGLPWRLPSLFGWADMEDAGWDRNTEVRDVDWLGGAFVMMRGDLVRSFDGLDEDFFFYGEDIVLSHRIARAGYRRVYDARATITHLGAGSSDPTKLESPKRLAMKWSARYLVQKKCYGAPAAYVLRVVDIFIWTGRSMWRSLTLKRDDPRRINAKTIRSLLMGRLSDAQRPPDDQPAEETSLGRAAEVAQT